MIDATATLCTDENGEHLLSFTGVKNRSRIRSRPIWFLIGFYGQGTVKAGPKPRHLRSLNVETFPISRWWVRQSENSMRAFHQVSRLLTAVLMMAASSAFAADDGNWSVGKSSGEVWLSSSGTQPASLNPQETLRPGDTVRTGRTGRVLLQRGEETILISPNSVIGLPAEKKEGLSTTIIQRAGSILLEVEKRNVKHFEVETPYLAAVVKGTRFSVTVNGAGTTVDVVRGQVEVADFRSGQIAQVMAGQHATTSTHGGLSLGGAGTLNPIEQGKPRVPSVEQTPVPKAGLSARDASNVPAPRSLNNDRASPLHAGAHPARAGATRISSSIGEVRLNFHRVTHGLAHERSSTSGAARNLASNNTVWTSSGSGTAQASAGQGGNASAGNSSAGSSAGAAAGVAGNVAAAALDVVAGNNGVANAANGNGHTNNGIRHAFGHFKIP